MGVAQGVVARNPMAHILVVDDESDIRDVTALAIADAGYRVETAADGRQGLDRCRSLRPQIVVTDVRMPEMDGISAVREIMRSQPTDILMISSLTREGARATLDALDAGAVDFLPKLKLETACSADVAERVVEAIQSAASTGKIGDGKIWVCSLEEVVRIRTGETGAQAI